MMMLPPVRRIGRAEKADARYSRAVPPQEKAEEPLDVLPAERSVAVEEPIRDRFDESAARTPARRAPRPYAPLVAQLIATTLGVAQTRPRRRAAVTEAIAAYRRDSTPRGISHGIA